MIDLIQRQTEWALKIMIWHHIEQGEGRPLVLLHGIGMSAKAWSPVMNLLAAQRRVIAFDVPGFGETPALEGEPSMVKMVASLNQCLTAMGIDEPVDCVGNSMGGYIALSMAVAGHARSVVALSPAGFWGKQVPMHVGHLFQAMRRGYRLAPGLSDVLLSFPPSRTLIMMGGVGIKGWRIPAAEAIHTARMFAESEHFETIYHALGVPFTQGGSVDVPCTIAWGDFDMVFPIGTRVKRRAPAHSRWLRLRGCGHVPMWDNPELVADTILHGTS